MSASLMASVLQVVQRASEPVSAPYIAVALGCGVDTVLKHLTRLEAREVLRRRAVAGGADAFSIKEAPRVRLPSRWRPETRAQLRVAVEQHPGLLRAMAGWE